MLDNAHTRHYYIAFASLSYAYVNPPCRPPPPFTSFIDAPWQYQSLTVTLEHGVTDPRDMETKRNITIAFWRRQELAQKIEIWTTLQG